MSSGNRTVHRLSLRGNRRLNHAVHMAAVTQIARLPRSGRACYEKKPAEGKTAKEALRALKRQVSDAIYKRLKAGAARAGTDVQGPGGHPGNDTAASAAGYTPNTGSSAKPLPDLPNPTTTAPHPEASVTGQKKDQHNRFTQRGLRSARPIGLRHSSPEERRSGRSISAPRSR